MALLGGAAPEPERCEGATRRAKVQGQWQDVRMPCGALVVEAVDSDAFCNLTGCPYRKRARGHG